MDYKKVGLTIYWSAAVFVSAIMFGTVYRREMPLSVIRAFRKVHGQEGMAGALLCCLLYGGFYSVFFAVPFLAIRSVRGFEDLTLSAGVAAWAGLTLLMFAGGLFAFVRAMPSFWLWIPWVFLSVFWVRSLWRIHKQACN